MQIDIDNYIPRRAAAKKAIKMIQHYRAVMVAGNRSLTLIRVTPKDFDAIRKDATVSGGSEVSGLSCGGITITAVVP